MPTLSGIRRRGFTPEAIRTFCGAIGATRTNGTTDIEMLEHFQRDDLNRRASRAMVVLRPLKVVIDNYPEGSRRSLSRWPIIPRTPAQARGRYLSRARSTLSMMISAKFRHQSTIGSRRAKRFACGMPISLPRRVWSRTQQATSSKCTRTYDPASRGGNSPDGRKVKSTIHWVSTAHAISAEIRLYDKLFTKSDPNDVAEGESFLSNLNPDSLEILTGAKLEPSLADAKLGQSFQFERVGYFCLDSDSTADKLVFNRTLPLKDSWAKIEKKAGA